MYRFVSYRAGNTLRPGYKNQSVIIIMYSEMIAVCSQIHTKHKYPVWAERRNVECTSCGYVQWPRLMLKLSIVMTQWWWSGSYLGGPGREPATLNIVVFVSILRQMAEYWPIAVVFPFFILRKSLFANYRIIPLPTQFHLPTSSLNKNFTRGIKFVWPKSHDLCGTSDLDYLAVYRGLPHVVQTSCRTYK